MDMISDIIYEGMYSETCKFQSQDKPNDRQQNKEDPKGIKIKLSTSHDTMLKRKLGNKKVS